MVQGLCCPPLLTTTDDIIPIAVGDMGPSPKELSYSALGSCTVMTMRTFFENSKAIKGSSWSKSSLEYISVMLDEVKGKRTRTVER